MCKPINLFTRILNLELMAMAGPQGTLFADPQKTVVLPVREFWLLPRDHQSPGFTPEHWAKAGCSNIGELIAILTDRITHSEALRQHIRRVTPSVATEPTYCHVFRHVSSLCDEVLSVCYGDPFAMRQLRISGHRSGGRHLPWL